MSLDATRWAWKQTGIRPMQKLVLLSLADRADEHHSCHPSISRLSADTGMYRETIMEAIAEMEEKGIIKVNRRLGTGSIYHLIGVENRHQDERKTTKTSREKPTSKKATTTQKVGENQSAKPDQYGKADQSGKADSNQSGKADTESTNESINTLIPPNPPFDPSEVDLPNCIRADQWKRWVEFRRSIKKPITRTTADEQLRKLIAWSREGHDPNEILSTSIANTWQGIFKPKTFATHGQHQDNSAPAQVRRAIAERNARRQAESFGASGDREVIDGEFERVPF